ncbi:Hint domain-containing protein [Nioella sediminis]|uniref:Hint domain-containing protein n=1 Tax=Nioella sediminis TaxID=1912092 RepID=UPI0008FD8FAC|nr:Hint domain-containing protein [Nioella sediminis]
MASIGNLYFHGTFHELVGTFTPIPLPGPYTLDDGNGAGDTVFTSGEDVNQPFTDGSVTDGFYGTYEKDGVVYIVCRQGPYYDLYSTTDPAVATLAAGTVIPTFNTADFTTCFLGGTSISTPDGSAYVESLQIGDWIVTHDGSVVPVKWIGRQTVVAAFRPAERLMPVRFAAGSLGDGLPHTDLTVTADHGVLIEGVICHAGALVNDTTITRVPLSEIGETYTVYHIETEDHEIILANGAPAETFIDNVSRRVFDNYAEFEALYGDVPEMEELPYPRAMSARQVPVAIKVRLDGKAVA